MTIVVVLLLMRGALPAAVVADTAAELREKLERTQDTYDRTLAKYNRAVEATSFFRGEVAIAELDLDMRRDELESAREKRPGLSDEELKNAYAQADTAYEDARIALNDSRRKLAVAERDASVALTALSGYYRELVNLNRQLANFRFRSLQEELSQQQRVVVRTEFACENVTLRACKEGALELAKRAAVEQGSAVLVQSETVMEEMQVFLGSGAAVEDRHVTRDWIASQVKGVLVSYAVLAKGWVGETGYFYEIEAMVTGQISSDFLELAGTEGLPVLPSVEPGADAEPFTDLELIADHAVGTKFRDCRECPELVVVAAGSFMMGSPAAEAELWSREGPRHQVTIAYGLAVGRYEVTFAEWDACVKDGGCARYRPDDMRWGRLRRPVINVSWDDAQTYLEWLRGKTGHEYRLLSESEWEYVARAGTSTPFHTGSTISTEEANYDGNHVYGSGVKGTSRQQTVPVGSFRPNQFGLHDVHGNVWEWVEDCWNESYVGVPADGSAWRSGDCSRRVLRGGSWFDAPWFFLSASRSMAYHRERDINRGFRVVRTH